MSEAGVKRSDASCASEEEEKTEGDKVGHEGRDEKEERDKGDNQEGVVRWWCGDARDIRGALGRLGKGFGDVGVRL